jgi:hypothetical protein
MARSIVAVARALLKKGTLSYRQVQKIMGKEMLDVD